MQSEFYNVALDRIRYSLVWEDSGTLYDGLQLQPSDKVLVITSAGCNVLNVLLKKPAQVTAIDLNPVQNQLLQFKKHLILHFGHHVFRGLLGLDGPETVTRIWREVVAALPGPLKAYWDPFFQSHPEGLLSAGRLESYLNNFFNTLPPVQQRQLKSLLQFSDVAAQHTFFMGTLDGSSFREQFITYFDEANLSKGRDPRLFKYALESGGEAFYSRLVKQISTSLVKDNFFFRFFFFGAAAIPEQILPPCYQERHYNTLRAQLPALQVVAGEAVDFLLSPAGKNINKASLSNIFEYASEAEFRKVCQKLYASGKRPLQFIFWNLLQEQGIPTEDDRWETNTLSDGISRSQACFYFSSVRVLAPSSVPVSV